MTDNKLNKMQMVKAWREMVTIPTYEIGKAEKNPMFLEKRVYQGSSGVVYPYPVVESIADKPTPHEWKVIFLENDYLKVMVMPELGGRIQMAYDKIRQRHFVYYNHVVKPALVGLTGPWVSGGIEFNWPQHHRPSTYLPVDSDIVENSDGSVTVWVNEVERMFGQKGMAGFTLRPGCAYLEIQGRVSNRSSLPQTFLWWANPAVEVNDAYQSVFPPDVNAVFDHGKRAVSSFPIATGTYYKMDYSAGVDISNYRNIKVPTSYMAVNSKYDFEGGYENDTRAGMLHVASHHVSPGKKQWTWGNGDFGRAWDRNLTDDAGQGFRPYIELMAGVFTENQPDFTWLMPHEEKRFVQYFMPYREVGIVKQATRDFVFNIEERGERREDRAYKKNSEEEREYSGRAVQFKVMATSTQEVRLVLRSADGEVYYNKVVTLSPEEVLSETVDVRGTALQHLRFDIMQNNLVRLSWQAEPDEIRPIPDAAVAARLPKDVKTNDELYHTGLHLEQYRHATWNPVDYYEEALRRDPDDVRCLNALGRWYLRRGRFDKAVELLRHAVAVAIRFNPNPYDGEPFYNLALALKYRDLTPADRVEAHRLLRKAAWSLAWKDAALFEAGRLSMLLRNYDDAVEELTESRCNEAVALLMEARRQLSIRQSGHPCRVEAADREAVEADPFDYMARFFIAMNSGADKDAALRKMDELMRTDMHNYHQLAVEYADAGEWQQASDVLQTAMDMGAQPTPMTYYYLGWFESHSSEENALGWIEKAERVCADCCFPNRLEDIVALLTAKRLNPGGARAPYYLGCLYYDKRQYDVAIENWECSARLDAQFPAVWRNLALARFNKQGRPQEALDYMERAFALDTTDARMLMELDQLYKHMQKPHQFRLDNLQKYPELIALRDDLVLEEITLLNQLGHYNEAKTKLDGHQFHPWEGGEGKVPAQYQIARLELAKRALGDNDPDLAVALLNQCLDYPHHLGEGKLYGAQENDFYYFLGVAYDMLAARVEDKPACTSLKQKARRCWLEATKGPQEPAAAMYYNDAKPDKIFYQGLALRKLADMARDEGKSEEAVRLDGEANGRFYRLLNYGQQHIFEKQLMDYFAVSLPDLLIWEGSGEHQLSELDAKNRIHCLYMLALGYYGLGDMAHAQRYIDEVACLDINHQGVQALATLHLK